MDKWTNVCRSCLVQAESFSYYIYENVSPEIYSFCTSIEVKQDELPKSLCTWCYDLLTQFAQFKKTCLQSENKLHGYSNSLKLENETGVKYVEIEIKNEKIDNLEVTAVLVNANDKLNNDPSNANIYGNSQVQKETVLKREASNINRKSVKTRKPRVQKRPLNYTCQLCRKQFVLKERFEAHKLKHEGNTAPIQCKSCDKTFATWSGLQRHEKTDHSSHSFKDVTCTICYKVYKSPYTLKIHYRIHEDRKVQICDECGKQFKTALILKNHLKTHIINRQPSFACQHCGKKYLSKGTRAMHILHRHSEKRYICHYCNYRFGDKANLIKHIKLHEGTQKIYKCDMCFRILASSGSLVEHKRIHTGEKPFLCNFCPKTFASKSVLVTHQRVHTGEKPFKCVVCEQSFGRRESWKRHMKVHNKI